MSKKLLVDVAERAIWTYVQSFIGILLAGEILDVTTAKVAAVAALPALLAVIKGFAASRLGEKDSASTVSLDEVPS